MAHTDRMIVNGVDFNAETDYTYTKPKVNASGGKSIGIVNKHTMKVFVMNTPLMLTWGVNEFVDEKSGKKSYDMSLQFPKEEYNSEAVQKFLENMIAFENKLKKDAIANSKEWMNKVKMSTEVVDALWTPMVKYPKDQNTGEPDLTRPPTLRVKFPVWDGEWKCELYDMEQKKIFPNENGLFPQDLIAKATNVATMIQCGGLWFANGKFGVTWRLVQAVVKPKQSLQGQCFIQLTADEKATMRNTTGDDDSVEAEQECNVTHVEDSSEDEADEADEVPVTPQKEVKAAIEAEVSAPPAPKKKVVARRKKTAGD
jgi:hypothetical protein